MERLIANMYIYTYNNIYAQSEIMETLTTYSDAIVSVLGPDGPLYTAYAVFRTLAFGLLAVYFVITLGTRFMGREMSTRILFKTLLEYSVGLMLALNSFEIVRMMFQLGDSLAETLNAASASGAAFFDDYSEAFTATVADMKLKAQVQYLFKALVPYILCVASNIVITYTIVSRVLRICINAAASPVAVVNYFDGTRHADAVRFLKRTFAMALQCSAIVLISSSVALLTQSMMNESVYSEDLGTSTTIEGIQRELISTMGVNSKAISNDVDEAVNAHGILFRNKLDVLNAEMALEFNVSEVGMEDESTYKGYEAVLSGEGLDDGKNVILRIFERDADDNYVYEGDYAKIRPKYMKFTNTDKVEEFMDAMFGGDNYFIFLVLLVIKMGLIKKSNSLCNSIVGL